MLSIGLIEKQGLISYNKEDKINYRIGPVKIKEEEGIYETVDT